MPRNGKGLTQFVAARKARSTRRRGQVVPEISQHSWFDVFGNAHFSQEATLGVGTILVACPLELATQALDVVADLKNFCGQIVLAVLQDLHTAPILASIQFCGANTVIALEKNCVGVAARGPSISTDSFCHLAISGLEYVEVGQYLAWHNQTSFGFDQNECPSRAASLASGLGLNAFACNPDALAGLLSRLFQAH